MSFNNNKWKPEEFIDLFSNVLSVELEYSSIKDLNIEMDKNLKIIAACHKESSHNLSSSKRVTVDYSSEAARCAYVHRFSSLYTALAYEVFSTALRESEDLRNILCSKLDGLRVCCLGGGPGTDLVGVWSALYLFFGTFSGWAQVVDKTFQWNYTLNAVIEELQTGDYSVSPAFDPRWFYRSVLFTADLLDMSMGIKFTIGRADLVTMLKFLSAAACKDTEKMLEEIFNAMKPGALVFFINNAAGGFHELVNRVAEKFRFITLFGPICHLRYCNKAFKVFRYGTQPSLFKTTVTVQILQKPNC